MSDSDPSNRNWLDIRNGLLLAGAGIIVVFVVAVWLFS